MLGSDDAIVSTASLMIGVAAASASKQAILIAGNTYDVQLESVLKGKCAKCSNCTHFKRHEIESLLAEEQRSTNLPSAAS